MNKKFSTLMVSLLLASAFVGTANAALKPLEAGKAPIAGSKYAIGSAFSASDDKVTDYLTTAVTGSSSAAVANFGGLWTVSSGGTDLYILKSPDGKYIKNPNAAEQPAELTTNSEEAAKFSFDKTAGSFKLSVGGTVNYLCFNTSSHILYIHSGGSGMGYAKLATLTADALTAAAPNGVDAGLQASIDKNNYYFVAAAPAGGGALTNVLKATSASAISTTAYTAIGNDVENYLWKVSSQKVGGTYIITFENKKFSDNKVIRFAKLDYSYGINLYADFECTVAENTSFNATSGASLVLFGIYQSLEAKKTEGELNKILGNGFELTIDTEKDDNATIEGIAAFEGTLVAVGENTGDATETRFRLKNGKKVVALNTDSKWGADNVGVNKRGYKFELMDATDVDNEKQYSWFEFVTNAGATDNKQVNRIDVYNDESAGSRIGSLYIISIDGKNYLTTSVNKDEDETWPYLYLGSDNIVKVKDLVGKFWKIKYADTRANAKKNEDPYKEEYKYKGILVAQSNAGAANQADYVLASTVYANAPEAQWGVTGANVTDNKVTLSNRETKETITGVQFRKSGDNYIMYADAAATNITQDLVTLEAVEISEQDGYAVFTESELKNSNFYLGQYHAIEGNNHAYFVENHASSHQIGLTAVKENADKWNLKLATRPVKVNGVEKQVTDTVYVYTNLTKLKSDGTVDSKYTETHIAILPYVFQKAANKEFMNSKTGLDYFICDPDEDNANKAARFALKMKADGSYNFVEIDNDNEENKLWSADKDKLDNIKVRVANSLDKGSLKTMALYSEDDNSLMVVEKAEAPEYHKIAAAWGDTIQLARANNTDQVIYEQADAAASKLLNDEVSFLNIENVNDPKFAGLNGAIFADTAYINREGNTTWQYLLAVKPSFGYHKENCNNPAHGAEVSAAVDTVYGNFLVNLIDTANLYAIDHLHNNPYLTVDNMGEAYAKLSFVPGFHTNDTLYIVRASGDTVKLGMGTEDFNVAKFAFRYVDQDAKSFKIQTQYKKYVPADSEEDIADIYANPLNAGFIHNEGYLAWVNGVLAVVEGYEAGDVFTIAENVAKAPTANDAISAEAGVQVIGGQGVVTVQGAAGKVITVANILGQTIANQVAASDNVTIAAPAGVVVVAVEGEATKVVVK